MVEQFEWFPQSLEEFQVELDLKKYEVTVTYNLNEWVKLNTYREQL